METIDIIKLVILVILLFLSGFFSSAETAFTTCGQVYMKTLAKENNKRAKKVLKITENQNKMLSAILIGNNLVNISASSLLTTLAIKLFGNTAAGIATGVLTLLVLIFGEISPKTMATLKADKLALSYCNFIWGLMIVLTPVIWIVNKLSYGFLWLVRVNPDEAKRNMTEAELRVIVEEGSETGVIEEEEKEMIHNLFDFGDDEAKEVMIPRIDMVFMKADFSFEEMMQVYRENFYTRFPVYEDTAEKVIGILNMKDVLAHKGKREEFSIKKMMREPFFTYEHKNTYELFMEMKDKGLNFAIVLDDFGMTAGLVTMEDLLEEIVGEIRDEYDSDEKPLIEKLSALEKKADEKNLSEENKEEKISPAVYKVEGLIRLEDFCHETGLELSSEDSDTLAGYLLELFDHFPEVGEKVKTKDEKAEFEILSLDKKRIEYVRCTTGFTPGQLEAASVSASDLPSDGVG